MLINLFGFPILHKRFDTVPLFTACMVLYPLFYIATPIFGALVRMAAQSDSESLSPWGSFVLWVAISSVLLIRRIASMAFP